MKRIKVLFIIPVLLTILSYFPLNEAVKKAKFQEKWLDIVSGLESITGNSEFLDELYGSNEKPNAAVIAQMLHLYETDGLYISEYNQQYQLQSDPEMNAFTTFNPMAFSSFYEDVIHNEKGESIIHYAPIGEQSRDVYTYFRWLPGRTYDKEYLIIIASSVYALKTRYAPHVVIVYMISLSLIVASIILVVLINNRIETRYYNKIAKMEA